MSKMNKILGLMVPMCTALLLSGCRVNKTDTTTITLSTTDGKGNQEALNRFIEEKLLM